MTRAPWVSHFGFSRTPFSKTIPAGQLCDRASHQEAVARIRFCIAESLLGVITGEVGVGKTVAIRAATSQLDPTAHHVIYISTPTLRTLAIGLALFKSEYLVEWNLMMAASTLMLLPILVLFFLAQRYFVQGIVMTGIKG